MVTIKNSQIHGKLDERYIEEIESLIGYRLPQDYREFLLAHNGGRLDEEMYLAVRSHGHVPFDEFPPFDPGLDRAGLDQRLRSFQLPEIPNRYLFIATLNGPFGLMMALDGPDQGTIYIYDSEIYMWGCNPGASGLFAMDFVARSFSEVLRQLISSDEADRQLWLENLCKNGQLDEIERVVAGAADINIRDELGRSLTQLAAQYNHRELVEKLVQQGVTIEGVLLEAVKMDDLGFTMFALSYGADTEERDEYLRFTPLMFAVTRRFFNIAKLLIEHGADTNAHGRCGETPLSLAKDNEAFRVLLIASGAK